MDEPRIVKVPARTFVGLRRRMTLSDDRTSELWRGFRERIGEIKGRIGTDRFSLHVFAPGRSYANIDPSIEFDKWAAVETESVSEIPTGMERIMIPGGEYAVFVHKGTPQMFARTFGYIVGEWLPASGFEIDDRPQFEVLGENYSPFDPESEEGVWIPIRTAEISKPASL